VVSHSQKHKQFFGSGTVSAVDRAQIRSSSVLRQHLCTGMHNFVAMAPIKPHIWTQEQFVVAGKKLNFSALNAHTERSLQL